MTIVKFCLIFESKKGPGRIETAGAARIFCAGGGEKKK